MSAALVSKLRLIAEKMPREGRDICTAAARTIEQEASVVAALARLIPVADLLNATTNGLTMVNYFRAKLVEAEEARAIVRELMATSADVAAEGGTDEGVTGETYSAWWTAHERARAHLGEGEA